MRDKQADVKIRALSFSYHGAETSALNDVYLDINPGEKVGIIGPNGSGKTTLAYVVAGIIPYLIPGTLRGSVEVLGRTSSTCESVFDFARQTSVLLQNPEAQLLSLTVEDELLLSSNDASDAVPFTKGEMQSIIDRFGIGHLTKRSVRDLSMGEMQRVAIVSALARRSRLVVWDEPTAALDTAGVELARAMLSDDDAQSRLVVTHDIEWAQATCTRVVGLSRGTVLFEKATEQLQNHEILELHPQARLDEMLRATRRIAELRGAFNRADSLAKTLSLNEVSYRYPGASNYAVTKLRFEVKGGSTFCLLGPNGSGKSTVLQLLAGMRSPSSGTVLVNGESLPRVRKRMGAPRFVSLLQNPTRQLVGESIRTELRNWIWDGENEVQFEEDLIDAVCSALGGVSPDSDPRSLSFGWQRAFTLLCCLCSDADAYFIDEPDLGLDVSMQKFAVAMIHTLAIQLNRVVVLSCHTSIFVEQVASTVAVLQNGELSSVGDPREVLGRVQSSTI